MKSFRQLISEVAQPKSKDELNFKGKHVVDMMDHPESEEHQHTSNKRKAKRMADYDTGEDMTVYEATCDDDEVDENAFIAKAAAAKKAGKDKFKLDGEKYPVTIKKDTAKKIVGESLQEKAMNPRQKAAIDQYMKSIEGKNIPKDLVKASVDALMKALKEDTADKIMDESFLLESNADKMISTLIAAISKYSDKREFERAGAVFELWGEKFPRAYKKLLETPGITGSFFSDLVEVLDIRVELDESTDLTENFSAGSLTLDDGSRVVVNKKDADLLNQMFDDLNPTNRREMMKVAMSDKDGFKEIRGFAREAL